MIRHRHAIGASKPFCGRGRDMSLFLPCVFTCNILDLVMITESQTDMGMATCIGLHAS